MLKIGKKREARESGETDGVTAGGKKRTALLVFSYKGRAGSASALEYPYSQRQRDYGKANREDGEKNVVAYADHL